MQVPWGKLYTHVMVDLEYLPPATILKDPSDIGVADLTQLLTFWQDQERDLAVEYPFKFAKYLTDKKAHTTQYCLIPMLPEEIKAEEHVEAAAKETARLSAKTKGKQREMVGEVRSGNLAADNGYFEVGSDGPDKEQEEDEEEESEEDKGVDKEDKEDEDKKDKEERKRDGKRIEKGEMEAQTDEGQNATVVDLESASGVSRAPAREIQAACSELSHSTATQNLSLSDSFHSGPSHHMSPRNKITMPISAMAFKNQSSCTASIHLSPVEPTNSVSSLRAPVHYLKALDQCLQFLQLLCAHCECQLLYKAYKQSIVRCRQNCKPYLINGTNRIPALSPLPQSLSNGPPGHMKEDIYLRSTIV